MIKIQQTYKNRAQALRFLQDIGFTSSERTFYGDCSKRDMIEPDGKSIQLSSLIAYLWSKFPPIPVDGQGAVAESRAEEYAKLDLQEKRLKVAKLERADDHVKKLEQKVADNERQRAALLGLVYDTLRHHITINGRVIALAAGADSSLATEIEQQVEQIIDQAFNEIATSAATVEMEFTQDAPADPATTAQQ